MTTFAQWRSPGSRLPAAHLGTRSTKYDIRVLDHFYAYCSAIARAHRHRDEAARSQSVVRKHVLGLLIGAGMLSYYLIERVALAMSIF